MKPHIILCGFGHVGFRVFSLLARLDERVVVIAHQKPERWPTPSSAELQFVVGDARDDHNLLKADIAHARTIIVVTNDDMTNVSIALDAKRLNPLIRTVVRLSDQDLASYLEKTMGIDRALCISSLCVPMFASAALGDRMRGSVEVDGRYHLIEEIHVHGADGGSGETLREFGVKRRKAVLALWRGREVVPAPLESELLGEGDVVVCLGMARERASRARRTGRLSKRRRLGGRDFTVVAHGIRAWWHEAPKALRTALIALVIVVLGSIAVFHWGLGLSFLDSTYFVVTIVSTTGFGDFNLMGAPTSVKVYGIFLMLCGAAIVATLFSIVSDLVVSTRFRDVLAKGCSRYKGHFIVAGLGNVGLGVVRELVHHGEETVAIEVSHNTKYVETARSLVPVVLGNARTEETLRKAGVTGARAVIAVTDNDVANLSAGLAARRLNPHVHTVLRIFDANLADKMCHGLKTNAVLSTSSAASPAFIGVALAPHVLFGFEYHGYLFVLFRKQPESPHGSVNSALLDGADGEALVLLRTARSKGFTLYDPNADLSTWHDAIGVGWYRLKDGSPV